MNLPQAISVLANIAVFGGILFLGYETRQNTVQLRAVASYSITEGLNNLSAGISGSQELAALIIRGEQDSTSLSPVERAQFSAYQFGRINLALHVLILEEDGVVDVQFPYVDFLINEYHRKPGLQQFLASIEDGWAGDPEFFDRLRLDEP